MEITTHPETAPSITVRREDYRPYPWRVPHVELHFALGLETTRVLTKLNVARNADVAAETVLRLNGDGIEPCEVWIDEVLSCNWSMDGGDLLIPLAGERHEIKILTQINPSANTQLMGLYASNQMLCTQCEAEGFRRITFFPDRPDILSTYRVYIEGNKVQFPVLLSNGNCISYGDGPDDTHWSQWDDPWPKPCYLFALVAGQLVANRSSFTTMSGRNVELAIWVREGDLSLTQHAMDSLIASMKWDEEVFGREYDLELFHIVAVSDFNMGAMENKSLNLFNTRFVLADPETATDVDFDAIERVIGHEYFHNWSGNRVTCRDWFQLSLKEGLTVLRDQLFCEDLGSAPVKRIENVRRLRSSQFPEDSGPLAHPIRPDSYQEISNFYSATVYSKGAEVIRMMRTIAGKERFCQGTDLYFERHDGQAATCEQFIQAIEDGARIDLRQFRLWYSQAGTPHVTARLEHRGDSTILHLEQFIPPTPGQPVKKPMPIPLKLALIDRETAKHEGEQLILLCEAKTSVRFSQFMQRPVLSINRGFSAPVVVDVGYTMADLSFLAEHDDDPFTRYEAMQSLVVRHLVGAVSEGLPDKQHAAEREAIGTALKRIIADPDIDDLMRGELLTLPTEAYLAEQLQVAHPGAIRAEREELKSWLSKKLYAEFTAIHDRACSMPYNRDAASQGTRKLKTLALVYLAAGVSGEAAMRAAAQYQHADNMTDRQGALMVLCGLDVPSREEMLCDFHLRYKGNALVIDKWFSLQTGSMHPGALGHVKMLAAHPDFTLNNPNRVRALYMGLAMNYAVFHTKSGEGYRVIADLILTLDTTNAQMAASFVPLLGRWKRIESGRSALMKAELERILSAPVLSRDTREQVNKSLG